MSHKSIQTLTFVLVLLTAARFSLSAVAGAHAATDLPPGAILLAPKDAEVRGENIRVETANGEASLTAWKSLDDIASWTFTVERPSAFRVQIRYACAPDHGGRFVIKAGDHVLEGRALSSSGWNVYRTVDFGLLRFEKPGEHTIRVKPVEIESALMNLRTISLVPFDEHLATRPANTLTAAEEAAGWRLLFDGESTEAWRGYRREKFPQRGWTIDGDSLKVISGGGGGDIITVDTFGDFELMLEYKVSHRGNSGIMYLVTEQYGASWQSGPEFQILDDVGHGLPPTSWHSAGSVYDLYHAPTNKVVAAVGRYNEARLRVKSGIVEHWLNGQLVVRYDLNSDEWTARVRASKFTHYDEFGKPRRGHIVLQDHGDDIWFRNIKIRSLDEPGDTNS